jgi:hypothetical protein
MATILELIQKQKAFDAFINENMKTSTYKVGWDKEMSVEYEASKTYAAATADYAAAMLGTVIDKSAGKPKRDMPSIGELTGTLARMGDEWQIDNDRLERYYYMEGRLQDKMKNLTQEQYKAQYAQIVKYLFNPYELAAVAPHRRILAMYWEGLSDGQVTLTKTNNTGGVVWSAALENGISKKKLRSTDVVWSAATLETMDVLGVIQYAEDLADLAGKTVVKHRVSKATASLICQSKQLKSLIGLTLGKIKTESTPILSIDIVNSYLTQLQHAPIEVINDKGILNTGTAVSMFKDGRLVSQCADKVAVLKVSDPLEAIDPVPNKVYSSYFDNLISQWRNDNGRYVAYEMYAYPVFTGKNDVFILDVTAKEEA